MLWIHTAEDCVAALTKSSAGWSRKEGKTKGRLLSVHSHRNHEHYREPGKNSKPAASQQNICGLCSQFSILTSKEDFAAGCPWGLVQPVPQPAIQSLNFDKSMDQEILFFFKHFLWLSILTDWMDKWYRCSFCLSQTTVTITWRTEHGVLGGITEELDQYLQNPCDRRCALDAQSHSEP